MIINYVSDLHLESGESPDLAPEACDVVIIAGDVWNGPSSLYWLEEIAPTIKQPIIYVPGNHCFWDNDLHTWPAKAKQFCSEIGVHFLYNDTVEIKDTLFLGTTLWTDYSALGNQVMKMLQAQGVMNDFSWVRSGTNNITSDEILNEHTKARSWLEAQLTEHRERKTCVVTHHAPSKRSVAPSHAGSRNVPYYVSDLDEMILDLQPDVWIHGHIHRTHHYFIGDTLVASNARGHMAHPPPHRNPDFNSLLVLEF